MTADEFRALYDATAHNLLAFLIRRTQNVEDAADSLADTFLIAWKRRDQIPADTDEASRWLFGVSRNVLKRRYAADQRSLSIAAQLAQELTGYVTTPQPDDSLVAALKHLSVIDREIIEMIAWDQLAPREVAAILGLSPNVVRIRAHRARLKLREHIAGLGPLQPNT